MIPNLDSVLKPGPGPLKGNAAWSGAKDTGRPPDSCVADPEASAWSKTAQFGQLSERSLRAGPSIDRFQQTADNTA